MALSVTPQVILQPATAEEAPLLANLLELYCHDMSEFFRLEVGADGRFGYSRLPLYWSEPHTHFAFLLRSDEHLAGFALVTRGSPATDNPDHLDLAEFFVLRSHRRAGLGGRAASQLWDRLPGHWVVRVVEDNKPGVAFWEGTIRKYTGGSFSTKEYLHNGHLYRVFEFTSVSGRSNP